MMAVRILIADDNEVFRSRLVEIMDGHDGWKVCAAVENGQDAVAKAKELKPDAVILDLAMPVMDGLTATREILRSEPTVPVFIYTLHNIPAIELEAKKAGARKMVLKPHVELLIRAIKETLANEAEVPDASSAPAAAIPDSPANQNAAPTEAILANQAHDSVVTMSAAPPTDATAPDSPAAASTTDGAGTNAVVADGDSAAPPAMGDPEPSS
jgi:DNA-binding NarL/FixJ family response regulator